MKAKKLIYYLILFIGCANSFSQELQKIIPLSPNAAAIARYTELPVGTFTGVPPIGIPLYTAKSRELEWPLALSYHAGGNKVETIPSWVGLGWSLGTVPIISRSVRGLPDEAVGGYFGGYVSVPINEVFDNRNGNQTQVSRWENFLRAVKEGTADPEPDLFSYNIASKSGNFYFDAATQSFQTYPHENIKISYNGNDNFFTLITESGVTYTFSVREKHTNSNTNPGVPVTISWLAEKMENANHTDKIEFAYAQETQYFRSTNSVTRYFQYSINGGCGTEVPPLSYESSVTSTVYEAYNLWQVRFSNGYVEMDIETSERQDLSGGHALKSFTVFNKSNQVIKKYEFDHTYLNSTVSSMCTGLDDKEKKRLMLTAVREIGVNGGELTHTFEYVNNTIPPCRSAPAQDYWGYYNGRNDNIDLMPASVLKNPLTNVSFNVSGADRSVNPAAAQFGIIQKVNYPAGGYSEYEFEQNNTYDGPAPPTYITAGASLEGEETITTNHYEGTFEMNIPPDPVLNGNQGGAFVNIAAGGFGCDLNGVSSPCANVTIQGLNNSFFMSVSGNTNNIYMPNGIYKMNALFNQDPPLYHGFFLLVQWRIIDPSPTAINKLAGGLRVKKITSYDGISHQNDMVRKYRYTRSLVSDTSSGNMFSSQFFSYVDPVELDYVWRDPQIQNDITCVINYLRVKSYSNIESVSQSGSYTGYGTVFTEYSNNNDFGITEQHFTNPPDVIDPSFPHAPAESFEHLRGLPSKTVEYKRENGALLPVKEIINEYNEHVDSWSFGYKIASQHIYMYTTNTNGLAEPLQEGIVPYQILSTQALLHKKTERVYDQVATDKYLETVTDYEYSPVHYQLINAKTTNSRQQLIQTKNYYPQDLVLSGAAELARQALINQNRVSAVLKTEKLVGNNSVEELINNYDKFNAGQIVMPAEILHRTGIGNPLESRIKMLGYTNEGNLTQQQKTNDAVVSYIWDYTQQLPIAEVKNASVDGIAYSSFEADGNGSLYMGNPSSIVSGDGVTGNKCYPVNNVLARFSLDPTKTYVVSLWTKNGVPNYNGFNGATQVVPDANSWTAGKTTPNGWTYREKRLSGVTIINIGGGGGLVDEVRIYPIGAQMMTYTYDPLIGATSQCDANSNIIYYEYDGFGRLKVVRDIDKNVLKTYDYKYQATPNQ